jgi:putative tricarboxylic transport membrane protein
MMRKDCISGLFFIFISILICVQAAWLKIGSLTNPQPGFLPFLSGAVLGIVSIGVALRSILVRKESDGGIGWREISLKRATYVVGVLIAYSLVISFLGFLLSTFSFFMLFFAKKGMSWWKVLLGSACVSVACYLFFVRWLQCQLPSGIFG